jgi:hypothetical protein
MGEDTGYGTDDFADLAVPDGFGGRAVPASATSIKAFGRQMQRTPTAGPRISVPNKKRGQTFH